MRFSYSNRVLLLITILSTTLLPATAQGGDRGAWAHLFAAPGAVKNGDSQGLLHLGAGGEVLLAGGLGVQIDIGVISRFDSFSESLGLLSPGLSYNFQPQGKTTPFVSGGYSLFFRSGTGSGMFLGGGVDHWFRDRIGLRVELRDQILLQGTTLHFLEGRIAILLR